MANMGQVIHIPGLVAGADLSAKQYKAVKFASTAGEVIAATAVGGANIGILLNDPADGEAAEIAGAGSIVPAVAATSTIAQGNYVAPNSTGLINTSVQKFGIALEASGAAGDIITVQVLVF